MASDLSRDLASLRIERSEDHRPARGRRWLVWLAVAVTGFIAIILVLSTVAGRVTRPQVRVSAVETVSPAQASVTVMSTGYVTPQRRALVAPRIVGRIATIHVHEGERLAEGQLIAELESADSRAGVAEWRAALKTAVARVARARAGLEEARLQLERERGLHGAGASSQATLETAKSRHDVAEADVQAAEAEVATAAARLDTAETVLRDTRILAPFAGRVVRKLAEVGEVPLGGAGGPGGVVELVDFESLVVEADVSEGRIAQVKLDGPAEITLDAFPTQRHRGRVSEIRPTVDRQKATVLTRVKFEDSIEGVLPQMAARVLFLSQELSPQALTEAAKVVVPASAVVERQGASFVFVVSEGRARLAPVVVGASLGDGREIKQGPPPGTKIVVDPPASLSDGDAVKEKV